MKKVEEEDFQEFHNEMRRLLIEIVKHDLGLEVTITPSKNKTEFLDEYEFVNTIGYFLNEVYKQAFTDYKDGGYCHSYASHFCSILKHLGYDTYHFYNPIHSICVFIGIETLYLDANGYTYDWKDNLYYGIIETKEDGTIGHDEVIANDVFMTTTVKYEFKSDLNSFKLYTLLDILLSDSFAI